MTQKRFLFLVIFTILIVGCSTPAAPTPAPSATAPPPPTPTSPPPSATPIPYNLTVIIRDPEGQPIQGAMASLGEASIPSDADGAVVFSDLPSDQASVKVSAQGYNPAELNQTLARGDNQAEINLEMDPFGLLPQDACAPGEKLLYIADFQDGAAHDWDAAAANAPGWKLEEDPDQPGNLVISARRGVEWANLDFNQHQFDQAIWRLRFKFEGNDHSMFNMRVGGEGRYMIVVGNGDINLARDAGGNFTQLGPAGKYSGDGWHLLEIGYLDDTLSVYIDGKEGIVYQDPQPWGAAGIAIENHFEKDDPHYYDNISVCEPDGAFQPLPLPKTGYDLTLKIEDADGNPISPASVEIGEAQPGAETTLSADASGMVVFNDLPGGAVTFKTTAPGYQPTEQSAILEKGEPAEIAVALDLDPFGLLPSKACGPDEKLLYLEDFQDGAAQGWANIQAAVELNAQNGWSIAPDESGNTILTASNSAAPANDDLQDYQFDNAVWRIKVMVTGSDTDAFLNWKHSFEQGDWRYFIPFGGQQRLSLIRFMSGDGVQAAQTGASLGIKKWSLFEISAFDGVIEAWLNGKRLFSYTDPQPLPPGTIGLEVHLSERVKATFNFDDISVCELSAPFVPLAQP